MEMNPGGDTMAPENNEPLYARGKKEYASTVKRVEVDIKRQESNASSLNNGFNGPKFNKKGTQG